MIILSVLLIVAAGGILLVGSSNKPDASICQYINHLNQQLGAGGHCQTGPTHAQYVWAAVLAVLGIVVLLARYVRGNGGSHDRQAGQDH